MQTKKINIRVTFDIRKLILYRKIPRLIKMYLFYHLLFLSINALSQSISVSSFKLLDSDLTANTAGTMEQDQNGEVAALIKVVTTQTGFSFDCGAMGIVKTLQKPSEIWVYVPRGVKKMTISHPQLGLLRDYFFPTLIDAARTYEMVLVSGSVRTIVEQTSRSQYLVLKVTPSNAIVELDNEILPTSNGIAQKFVKLGTYEYRVQAPDYHTAAGKVEVNDPNNKKVLDVCLEPAFGWIEIPSHQEYDGAQVYIDNALAGTIPMKSKNLASGVHSIKIVKDLYNPYSQTVEVKDNETTQLVPSLSANFSEVTVTVDNDADIYINDEKKGCGSWTGKLESGTYLIEAKKEGHRNTSQNIDISSSQNKHNINLTAPIPIYGEIDIKSTPSLANLVIDGKSYGQTPVFLPNYIIGKHHVQLSKDGYYLYETDIEVKELDCFHLSAEMRIIPKSLMVYGYSLKHDGTGKSAYANTYPVYINGKKTALIKIYYEKTGLNNLSFECPEQTIMKVDTLYYQYNLFIPEGTPNLKIKSNTTDEIFDIHFDTKILSGNDYRLNLFKRYTIKRIERKKNATIIYMTFNNFGRDSDIISISPNSYLETPDGKRYNILKAKGINFNPKVSDVKKNSIIEFSLVYPPLPDNTSKFNIIDDLENSFWNIYDIKL